MMGTLQMRMQKLAVLAAFALGQSAAMAQLVDITVTYGPVDVAAVPTLSEWGMVIMSVLLAVLAVMAIRKGADSKSVSAIALAAACTWGASQGGRLLNEADAAPPGMTSPSGGTVNFQMNYGDTVPVYNSTQVPLKVLGVTPIEALNAPGTTCTIGVVLAPNASCVVALPAG